MVQAREKVRAFMPIVAVLYALAGAIVLGLLAPMPAHAYVDPSVITYAIQAVAGVAVAISAVVGVAFRRTRKRILDLLGIDPESKKERDPSFRVFDDAHDEALGMNAKDSLQFAPDGEDEYDTPSAGKSRNRTRAGARDDSRGPASNYKPLSWPLRFLVSAAVSTLAVGTLVVVAPLEMVTGSASDFFFPAAQIAPVMCSHAIEAGIVLAIALSIVPGRAFGYVAGLVFSVGLCFYLQAMFMNTGLPIADGKDVDWAKFDEIAIPTTLAWLGAILGSLVLNHFLPRFAPPAFCTVAIALVIVQGAGIWAVLNDSDLVDYRTESSSLVNTEEGLLEVSDKDNIIVFVLDTYDTTFLMETLEAEPDLLDDFTGFTWYQNAVGAMIPTRYAVPFLLTDERPQKGEDWWEWVKVRYARSNYLKDIAESGFSVGVYTNDDRLSETRDKQAMQAVADSTINIVNQGSLVELDEQGTFDAMLQCALYRDMPWVLKPRYRFSTPEVRAAMVVEPEEAVPGNTAYVLDDAAFYTKLKKAGLSIQDNGTRGAFRFIHLSGAHGPYNVDKYGKAVESSTRIDQCIGSMRMVAYYLKQMKRLGIYDNATIIITADHGDWYVTDKDLVKPSSPIILAKRPQAHVDAMAPVEISDAPVVHDDILPTVIAATGADPLVYEGKSLFWYDDGLADPEKPRYYITTKESDIDFHDDAAVEWVIRGDVLDFDNWKKTGVEFKMRSNSPKSKADIEDDESGEAADSDSDSDDEAEEGDSESTAGTTAKATTGVNDDAVGIDDDGDDDGTTKATGTQKGATR